MDVTVAEPSDPTLTDRVAVGDGAAAAVGVSVGEELVLFEGLAGEDVAILVVACWLEHPATTRARADTTTVRMRADRL